MATKMQNNHKRFEIMTLIQPFCVGDRFEPLLSSSNFTGCQYYFQKIFIFRYNISTHVAKASFQPTVLRTS